MRGASQGNAEGYLVLEPFRTSSGVLLVVRGFVAGDTSGNPPAVTAPPTGLVRITGRLQTASSEDDRAATLGHGEIRSVNPTQQASRLSQPVYDAYVTLIAGQPGTSGVAVVPKPSLSNPAGGAYEAQHFAYIIQWYLFAVLALAAPFAMSRSETREAQRRFLGLEPGTRDFDRALAAARRTARVGRPRARSREGGIGRRCGAGARHRRALGRAVTPWVATRQPAGRPLRPFLRCRADDLAPDAFAPDGLAPGPQSDDQITRPVARAGHAIAVSEPVLGQDGPSSAGQPYRSPDGYHGSYNDYLWELAMADGNLPVGSVPASAIPADRGSR